MKTKATLKHISDALHLSISTVSRALKNHPDISDTTKQKVMELAALLEYEPNTYAINLRTNKSKIFGLMVPEISYYFYDSFISSVEEEARKIGYTLLILQSGDDPAIELENLKLCRANRVAGVFACLATGTSDISPFLKLDELDIPVVFFDKVPAYDACNKVCIADAEAAVMAASRIISAQRKHLLAIFGHPGLSITQKRLAAFCELIETAAPQMKLDKIFVNNAAEARIRSREFLELPAAPDTIFCMSDEILSGTMKTLQKMKKKIPEEVAVISISNDGFIPNLFDPEITYVETSGANLGKMAFERMVELMEGKKSFIRELSLPSRLVIGQSI